MTRKPKIAFIHRYGLEGWICCGGHAVPRVVEALADRAEIHFYGPRTTEARDPALRARLRMHELPYTWNRANPAHKITRTLLWYGWLPLVGLRCRLEGVRLVWNDETVPLTAPILRLCYGRNVAITVMDFFVRIYAGDKPWLRGLRDLLEAIDLAAWKKLPVLFTKVLYTQDFLAGRGVPRAAMHLYRNPVDHARFHPVDAPVRQAVRARLGFDDADIVLSHHGILHPNKGNDWILHRLAELKDELPRLKFLLVGNGPETGNLRKLSKRLALADRVVFAGWLPSERELNDALAAADIGLVMRIGQETDHFHMTDTLAHEMACGKPVLAVNLRGIAEVVEDGVNGFLFSPDDPAGFNRKLAHLARSEELRRAFGRRLRLRSRELASTEAAAKALLDGLGTLLC